MSEQQAPYDATGLGAIHRNDQRQRRNEEIINVTGLVALHYRTLVNEQNKMPPAYAAQLAARMQDTLLYELTRPHDATLRVSVDRRE